MDAFGSFNAETGSVDVVAFPDVDPLSRGVDDTAHALGAFATASTWTCHLIGCP